jgi:hypothetical protein
VNETEDIDRLLSQGFDYTTKWAWAYLNGFTLKSD